MMYIRDLRSSYLMNYSFRHAIEEVTVMSLSNEKVTNEEREAMNSTGKKMGLIHHFTQLIY